MLVAWAAPGFPDTKKAVREDGPPTSPGIFYGVSTTVASACVNPP
jgi:hypothetical protein